jgi:hypothetical protein
MTIGKGKRPRDPNQLAKWIVDQSTGDAPEPPQGPPAPPTSLPPDLSAYMAANTAPNCTLIFSISPHRLRIARGGEYSN